MTSTYLDSTYLDSTYSDLYGFEVLLVREAGGTVTSLDGARHRIETRTLIASNQECWSELQGTLAAAGVVGLDPSVEEAEAAEAVRAVEEAAAAAASEAEAAAAAEAATAAEVATALATAKVAEEAAAGVAAEVAAEAAAEVAAEAVARRRVPRRSRRRAAL